MEDTLIDPEIKKIFTDTYKRFKEDAPDDARLVAGCVSMLDRIAMFALDNMDLSDDETIMVNYLRGAADKISKIINEKVARNLKTINRTSFKKNTHLEIVIATVDSLIDHVRNREKIGKFISSTEYYIFII